MPTSRSDESEVPPHRYDARLADSIETRWQARWLADGTYHAPNPTGLLADDPAGAIVDPTTARRAAEKGLNPAKFLLNNDSSRFFGVLGDLVLTGPTRTNVNDFRVILIDS